MSTTYKYSTLQLPRNIRVLHLFPGTSDEPLDCEVLTIDLDDSHCPKFEALSYVWEDREPPFFITCRNEQIRITKNCHEALLHLRHAKKARTLWIDAICIDQSSPTERGQQVDLMGLIYGKANMTIAWIGPSTRQTSSTMFIMRLVAIVEILIFSLVRISYPLYNACREIICFLPRYLNGMLAALPYNLSR
jgi:hypothetical protein